jgi:hypothetical protein
MTKTLEQSNMQNIVSEPWMSDVEYQVRNRVQVGTKQVHGKCDIVLNSSSREETHNGGQYIT